LIFAAIVPAGDAVEDAGNETTSSTPATVGLPSASERTAVEVPAAESEPAAAAAPSVTTMLTVPVSVLVVAWPVDPASKKPNYVVNCVGSSASCSNSA